MVNLKTTNVVYFINFALLGLAIGLILGVFPLNQPSIEVEKEKTNIQFIYAVPPISSIKRKGDYVKPAKVPPVIMVKNHDDKGLRCLVKNILYEARGESEKGQRAVAFVTMNRVTSKRYPDSICEVVWQKKRKGKRFVAQFSWTLQKKLSEPSQKARRLAEKIARNVLSGNAVNPVGKAVHYHADYVNPVWASRLTKVSTIGRHIFYL